MKKLMLLGILRLVVAGGMNEAGARPCCSGSNTGADLTAGNPGAMPDATNCVTGHGIMASQRGMAGHEGTVDHCDPVGPVNSEAINGHPGSHQHGIATQTQSPMGQKGETTPDQLPADRK